jgi:hypothetical protein
MKPELSSRLDNRCPTRDFLVGRRNGSWPSYDGWYLDNNGPELMMLVLIISMPLSTTRTGKIASSIDVE